MACLIDTHCHLTFAGLREQADSVVQRATVAGVRQLITVATTLADAAAAQELVARQPQVFLAAGIHPHEAGRCGADDLAALADVHRGGQRRPELAGRIVAVGETGLDFHYDFAPRERQESVFRAQLELASKIGRPVVIHAREAERRVCEILADFPALAGRVVFHCFSGDHGMARDVLDRGCWLSFTGVVTFRNAEALRDAARYVPADRILVETDAPYLTPEPIRKQRPNEPAFLVHTARRLAEIRGEPYEEFARRTTQNARRFFGLPEVSA